MIFGRFIESGRRPRVLPAPRRRSQRPPRPQIPPAAAAAATVESFELAIPPFHWWRTVFFLIPAIGVYTIVLGTLSIGVEPVRAARLLRALVRAHLVAADPGHDRRARRRRRASSGSAPAGPIVFVVESPEHLRHLRCCSGRCRISCASSPRSRSGSFRSSAGICAGPATCWWTGGVPTATAIFAWAIASDHAGPVADRVPEGTRSRDGRVERFKGGSFHLALEAACRSCRSRSSAAGT